MNEAEFIESIDARFPYSNVEASRELIRAASAISSNASFMIAHELARPPAGIPLATLEMLLTLWANEFDHPLKASVERVCKLMIRGLEPERSEYIDLLNEVKAHSGEFNALAVLSLSRSDPDRDELYQSVLREWAGRAA